MAIKLPYLLLASLFIFAIPSASTYAANNDSRDNTFYDDSNVEDVVDNNDEYDEYDDEDFENDEEDEGFYYEDAFSDDEYADTRPFISIDALLGGQTLEKIRFDNGETDSIRAGSGVQLSIGITRLMFERKIDVGMKAGYLFDLITAENSTGDKSVLSFTRVPVEIFSHYWSGRHIWGGGLTAHFDPKFTSRNTSDNAKYHTAYGAYAEYLFNFIGTGSTLGVRFLNINYKNKKSNEVTDGSAWGITFTQLF